MKNPSISNLPFFKVLGKIEVEAKDKSLTMAIIENNLNSPLKLRKCLPTSTVYQIAYKSNSAIPRALQGSIIESSEIKNLGKDFYRVPGLSILEEEIFSKYPQQIESPLIKKKSNEINHNIFLKSFNYREKDENFFCSKILDECGFFRKSYNDMRKEAKKVGFTIKSYSEYLLECCKYLQLQKYSTGDYVYEQNDPGNKMYQIIKGEAQMFIPKTEDELKKDTEKLQTINFKKLKIPDKELVLQELQPKYGKRTNNLLRETEILDIDQKLRAIIYNRTMFPWISDEDLLMIGINNSGQYYEEGIFKYKIASDLHKNRIFGELALIKKCKRNATVIAKTRLEVITLNMLNFNKIFEATLESEGVKNSFFYNLFGSKVSRNHLVDMQRLFKEKTYSRGTYIFKEGDSIENMYIIRQGDVVVNKKKEDSKKVDLSASHDYAKNFGKPKNPNKNLLAVIGEYNFLGEDDYLCNFQVRTYSAKAISSPTVVYYIDKHTFEKNNKVFSFFIEQMKNIANGKNKFKSKKVVTSCCNTDQPKGAIKCIKESNEISNTILDNFSIPKEVNVKVKNRLNLMTQNDDAFQKKESLNNLENNPFQHSEHVSIGGYQNVLLNPVNITDIISDKNVYFNKNPRLKKENSKGNSKSHFTSVDQSTMKSMVSNEKAGSRSNSHSKIGQLTEKDFAKKIILSQKEKIRRQSNTARLLSYNTMNHLKYSNILNTERNTLIKDSIRMNSINSMPYYHPSFNKKIYKEYDLKPDLISNTNIGDRKRNLNEYVNTSNASTENNSNFKIGKFGQNFGTTYESAFKHGRTKSENQNIKVPLFNDSSITKQKDDKNSKSNLKQLNSSIKESDLLLLNAKSLNKNLNSYKNNYNIQINCDQENRSLINLGFKNDQKDDVLIKNSHVNQTLQMKTNTSRFYNAPLKLNNCNNNLSKTTKGFYNKNSNEVNRIFSSNSSDMRTNLEDELSQERIHNENTSNHNFDNNVINPNVEDRKTNSKIIGCLTSRLSKETKGRIRNKYNNIIQIINFMPGEKNNAPNPNSNIFCVNEGKDSNTNKSYLSPSRMSNRSVDKINLETVKRDQENVANFKVSLNKTATQNNKKNNFTKEKKAKQTAKKVSSPSTFKSKIDKRYIIKEEDEPKDISDLSEKKL